MNRIRVFFALTIALLLFKCSSNEEFIAPATQISDSSDLTSESLTSPTSTLYYYVSTSGNDTNGNGSSTKPWRTLRHAVTKVPANQGYAIKLSGGTFVEGGLIEVPAGVSIEGSGKDKTILKAASSFYHNPSSPGYALDRFLIRLNSSSPVNGNQSLKNFSIDGDGKKLHGGIYVNLRNNVIVENVNVRYTNFSGIWFWDVKDTKIKSVGLVNCSWGSKAYCSGALNIGNVERMDIDNLYVNEGVGYGVKAIGPSGSKNITDLKIRNSHISVNPVGLWNNGGAPNIAIELCEVTLRNCEISSNYVDNTISLISGTTSAATGGQAVRIYNNVIDIEKRAKGKGYAIELTIHDVEVDHNYIIKGKYGIANWAAPKSNWKIHHNVFYAIQGDPYPGEVLRSQANGLHNVKFYNNTIEFAGTKTTNVIGLYGGTSKSLYLKNNLIINNNTAYSYYPNQFIHTENGASISDLQVWNNLLHKMPIGKVTGTYLNNLFVDPKIQKTGSRPAPYYMPAAGSPLINAGVGLGFSFLSWSPDVGAYEYGAAL